MTGERGRGAHERRARHARRLERRRERLLTEIEDVGVVNPPSPEDAADADERIDDAVEELDEIAGATKKGHGE